MATASYPGNSAGQPLYYDIKSGRVPNQADYNRRQQQVKAQFEYVGQAMQGTVTASFASGLATAIGAAMGVNMGKLAGLAGQIVKGIDDRWFGLANEQAARAAQESTWRAYVVRRPRRRLPSYRVGTGKSPRYAGGALLRVLRAPDFYQADARGIRFINVGRLNREAKHWARLNYGAGTGLTRAPGQFELRIGGQVGARVGLPPRTPKPVRMPRGFWVSPGRQYQPAGEPGTGMFFPTRGPVIYDTFGITGTHFLDAGMRRLARELGVTYTNVLRAWLPAAVSQHLGPQSAQPNLNVRPPRIYSKQPTAAAAITAGMKDTYEYNRAVYSRSGRPEFFDPSIIPGGF